MTWIGWAVLIWAVLMLGGFALIGYWIGERRGSRRAQQAPSTAPLPVQHRRPLRTDTVQIPVQRLDVKA